MYDRTIYIQKLNECPNGQPPVLKPPCINAYTLYYILIFKRFS